MKVRFEQHSHDEMEVVVRALKQDSAVTSVMNYVASFDAQSKIMVVDKEKDRQIMLTFAEITAVQVTAELLQIYLKDGRKIAVRERLYKFQAQLDQRFVQISKNTIVNLYSLQQLTVHFGQVMAEMESGEAFAVSRRYVKKLKEALEVLTHG